MEKNKFEVMSVSEFLEKDFCTPVTSVNPEARGELYDSLKDLLDCVKTYGPEYMHGSSKQEYIKRAEKSFGYG